ncbi:MAG: hypothetical protein Q9227_004376 [Pyrenula ochraceoflavens]
MLLDVNEGSHVGHVLTWALASTVLLIFFFSFQKQIVSPNLPWVGGEKSSIAKIFANIKSTFRTKGNFEAAWNKFIQFNRACIVPSLFGEYVMLPVSYVPWVLAQPEKILSVLASRNERLSVKYTILDVDIQVRPLHVQVIVKDLKTKLPFLAPVMLDEIASAFDDLWGLDSDDWRYVPVEETLRQVVARVSNRVFVGLPLCRNKDYNHNVGAFAKDIPRTGMLIRCMPRWLRPILGNVVTIPNRYHFHHAQKYIAPTMKAKLAEWMELKQRGKEALAERYESSNDFLDWFVHSIKSRDPTNRETTRLLCLRLFILNLASIHTSTLSGTSFFFDLYSRPNTDQNLATLRAEACSILRYKPSGDSGKWSLITPTASTLPNMPHLDSAFRESLRLSSIVTLALSRTVTQPGGVTIPVPEKSSSSSSKEQQHPIHLPQGTRVGVAAFLAHHNPSNYPSPSTYQPFRFISPSPSPSTEPQPQSLPSPPSSSSPSPVPDPKEASATPATTASASSLSSTHYLTFGLGKHACPGRYFAVLLEKLIAAYVLVNYEVEMLEQKPESRWVGEVVLPMRGKGLKVRRRKVAAMA